MRVLLCAPPLLALLPVLVAPAVGELAGVPRDSGRDAPPAPASASSPGLAPLTCHVTAQGIDGEPAELTCGDMAFIQKESTLNDEVILRAGTPDWWRCLIMAAVCVCSAAFAAGLTLGLTSLDEFGLKVLCNHVVEDVVSPRADACTRSKTVKRLADDQAYATRILPLISGRFFGEGCQRLNPTNQHCLLVTLLLTNAAANEALPLFLDRLVPSWLAIILSVTVVLLFGEIAPSALFTGPGQLRLAAALSPAVRLLRFMLVPVVVPISLLLDWCLGHEEDSHNRAHMKAMARTLHLHGLDTDEVSMIHGVLEMHSKTPADISQPLTCAKMLAHDDVIDEQTVRSLLEWGHSRVFVYRRDAENPERRDDITGVLLVKKLLGIDLQNNLRVDKVTQALRQPLVLAPQDNLLNTLTKFQSGMCHLAVISESPSVFEDALASGMPAIPEARPQMFCSLEDVIEALLKSDIFDEEDAELGRPEALVRSKSLLSRTSAGTARLVGVGNQMRRQRRIPTGGLPVTPIQERSPSCQGTPSSFQRGTSPTSCKGTPRHRPELQSPASVKDPVPPHLVDIAALSRKEGQINLPSIMSRNLTAGITAAEQAVRAEKAKTEQSPAEVVITVREVGRLSV